MGARGLRALASTQLPLQLYGDDGGASLDDFHTLPANREVCAALRCLSEQPPGAVLYLHGSPGVGLSHLLQGSCRAWLPARGRAGYLPLADDGLRSLDPVELLNSWEHWGLLVLDDLQAVAGRPLWEEALLHFWERRLAHGTTLLLGARLPPSILSFGLADLRSRCASAVIYRLHGLGAADAPALLQHCAARRGLRLSEAVVRFIVRRSGRDAATLRDIVQRLDRATATLKRRVTVPLVKAVCGW